MSDYSNRIGTRHDENFYRQLSNKKTVNFREVLGNDFVINADAYHKIKQQGSVHKNFLATFQKFTENDLIAFFIKNNAEISSEVITDLFNTVNRMAESNKKDVILKSLQIRIAGALQQTSFALKTESKENEIIQNLNSNLKREVIIKETDLNRYQSVDKLLRNQALRSVETPYSDSTYRSEINLSKVKDFKAPLVIVTTDAKTTERDDSEVDKSLKVILNKKVQPYYFYFALRDAVGNIPTPKQDAVAHRQISSRYWSNLIHYSHNGETKKSEWGEDGHHPAGDFKKVAGSVLFKTGAQVQLDFFAEETLMPLFNQGKLYKLITQENNMPYKDGSGKVLRDSYETMIMALKGDPSIAGSVVEDFINEISDGSGKISESKLSDALRSNKQNAILFAQTLFRAIGKGTGSATPPTPPKEKIETFEQSFKNGTTAFIGFNQLISRLNNLPSRNRAGEISALKENALNLKLYLEKAKENSGEDINQFLEQKLVKKLDLQINLLIQTLELLESKEKLLEKAKTDLENGIRDNDPSKIGLIAVTKKSEGSSQKQIANYESIIDYYEKYKAEKKNDDSFRRLGETAKLSQFKEFFLKDRGLALSESSMYAQMEMEARYEDLKTATGGTFVIKDGGDLLDSGNNSRTYSLLSSTDRSVLQKEVISEKEFDSLKTQNQNAQKHLNNLLPYESLKTELIEYKKEYEKMIEAKDGEIKKVKDPEQALIYANKIRETQEKIEQLIGHSKMDQGDYGKIIHSGTKTDRYQFPASRGTQKIISNKNVLNGRVANAMVLSLVNKAREISNILASNNTLEADLTEFILAEKRSMKISEKGGGLYSIYYEKDGKTDIGKIREDAPYKGKDPKWCREYLKFDKKMEEFSDLIASDRITSKENQFVPLVNYLEENFPGNASSIRDKLERMEKHLRGASYADAKLVWSEILKELNDTTALTPAERIDLAKKTFLDPHEEKLDKDSKADSVSTYSGMKEVIRQRELASTKAVRHLSYLEKDHSGMINKDINAEAKQELRFKVAKQTATESIELIKNYQAVVDIETRIGGYKAKCDRGNENERKENYEKMNEEIFNLVVAKENLKDKLLTQFKASERFKRDDEGRIKTDPNGTLIAHDFKLEYEGLTKSKDQLLANLNEKFKSAFLNYATITHEQGYLNQISFLFSIADEDENKQHPFDTEGKDKKSGESKFKERMKENLTFSYISQNPQNLMKKLGLETSEVPVQTIVEKLQKKLGLEHDSKTNQETTSMALGQNGALAKDKHTFERILRNIKYLEVEKTRVKQLQKKHLMLNAYKPYNEVETTRKDRSFIELNDKEKDFIDKLAKIEQEIYLLEQQLYTHPKTIHLKNVIRTVEVPLREWSPTRSFLHFSVGLKLGSSTDEGTYAGGEFGLAGKNWVLLLGGQGSVPRVNSVSSIDQSSTSGNTTQTTTGQSERSGGNNNFALTANFRYIMQNGILNYINLQADVTGAKTTVKGDAKTTSNTQITGSITINSTLPVGPVSYVATNTFNISLPGLPATETVTLNTSSGTPVNLTGPGPHSVSVPTLFNPLPANPTPIFPITSSTYTMSLSYNGQVGSSVTATIVRTNAGTATIQFSGQLGSFSAYQTATTSATTQQTTEQQTYAGRVTAEVGKKINVNKDSSLLIKTMAGAEGSFSKAKISTDTMNNSTGVTTTTYAQQDSQALTALFGATANLDYNVKSNLFILIFGYTRAQSLIGIKNRDQFLAAAAHEYKFNEEFYLRLALGYDLLINQYNDQNNVKAGDVLRQHRWEATVTFGKKMKDRGYEMSLFVQQNREYALAAFGTDYNKIYNNFGLRGRLLFGDWFMQLSGSYAPDNNKSIQAEISANKAF